MFCRCLFKLLIHENCKFTCHYTFSINLWSRWMSQVTWTSVVSYIWQAQTNYWIWRIDPTYRTQDPERVKGPFFYWYPCFISQKHQPSYFIYAAALLQSTLVGFCYPHRGSAIGCSYINYPRCFCIACKYHHRYVFKSPFCRTSYLVSCRACLW